MVTIADVAQRAGVAPSTVSYVLSGKRSISGVTRARVEESVRALGYHPRQSARRAGSARHQLLGLVAPLYLDTNVPVLMRFVSAVALAAREHGLDVLLLTGDRGPEGIREAARTGRLDGLVVMDVEMHDARVPVLRELDQPSVLIGFPVDQAGLTAVDLDFTAAGARCLDHLADLGHQCVALLGSEQPVYLRDTGFAHRTAAGFTTAAVRRGVSVTTRATDSSPAAARAMIAELLREHPRLTGLVVHNEAALVPVLDALREFGRRVPEDMSVVALCPDELADRLRPRLTSVHLPAEELGRRAVELLRAGLAGDPAPALTLLPPRLTERASVRRRRPG
ncbi:DNA-binding LacI/PurR family transcriptional regulator [Crossiella equi]|uniref:DNA-binding LacI/PurR family transcriptional regulator n=1 Tax=Crossiella equi TaxID=130796 RepID=A0ABS5ASQ9_9PSEU|nr:LacI family DNA-binding transcriptional regulator [Crossiella equi]MBP2479596.1 DNA-binding LacI/PurR family transcriptional regulator [Crossiella equi]